MLSQTYEKYTQKYANFSAKQLAISLENAQKKEEKIKNELAEIKNLAKFLQKQLKNKNKSIPFKKTDSYKKAMLYQSQLSPEELDALRAELDAEINMDYGDEL